MSVAAGIEILRRLPPDPVSVPEARGALAPLEHAFDPATFETLRLLATELVATCVRSRTGEGNEQIELWVSASHEHVRVEVSCPQAVFAPAGRPDDDASRWGVDLVEAFSDRWGTRCEGRACIWFELVSSGAFRHRAAPDLGAPALDAALD